MMWRSKALVGVALAAVSTHAWSGSRTAVPEQCPGARAGTQILSRTPIPTAEEYNTAVAGLVITDVLQDIVNLLTDSQPCWPADESATSAIGQSYGGLFVRLAWHCSGSYRTTDMVGGCAGGRIRFNPEASWPDNVNLDKARALLVPIKEKYGNALSWGDLFVLAGDAAILHMGGPLIRVCVGRVDDEDGNASLPLGPSDVAPACPIPGNCPAPIGAAQIGLIYVNPQGFLGIPEPVPTAQHIRDVFGRMGMNDTETVALIGGGHAFGKSHGACAAGAGPGPDVQPENPWPGNCGTGRGRDTFSNGHEGPWTTDPFKWDNEYFQLLAQYAPQYTLWTGPGGARQWRIPQRPQLMMQTTDLALYFDTVYRPITLDFARNQASLDRQFAAAWYKLTMRGGTFAPNMHCWERDEIDERFLAPQLRAARVFRGNF